MGLQWDPKFICQDRFSMQTGTIALNLIISGNKVKFSESSNNLDLCKTSALARVRECEQRRETPLLFIPSIQGCRDLDIGIDQVNTEERSTKSQAASH